MGARIENIALKSVVAIGLPPLQQAQGRDVKLAIHSAASFVPRVPPISAVVFFCCTAASTALLIRSDSLAKPKCSSIMAAVEIAPMGLAMFLPANGGAEPCTGSNIEVFPGWILPLAAMPRPP